ncbi:pirin family protein [Polynucleobacter sp. AP-Nino-20-G2]|jgi:redox-sensitive bicupin YhaK (pirin superfamily)|uniref:pirin family protein n=1 Tax=Polynucleobacter sp. AP-Nino-20-G2 TaxID=2576917 RepID=UPI001BFD24BF|nr:pirin family protein [Polynucleobacter sp. AP-Nino-20-G2]QWE16647.1 pirin family protein [Polynucleobacter sp. AP-Nino-20-G2]
MSVNTQLRSPDATIGRGEGSGFSGVQWREEPGAGVVLLCDSYVMTAPTFPLHPHKHISAVAILFEDTTGQMYSSDSVGTNHHFGAGDVHWTLAGSGVEHTQTPEDGSKIHAVQMFIDLPQELRNSSAQTFHLQAKDAPIYEAENYRVRVLVGTVFGLSSPLAIAQDILIVEGWSKSDLTIPVPSGWRVWIYDRDHERAGYAREAVVNGHFLMVASPS